MVVQNKIPVELQHYSNQDWYVE